MTSGAGVCYADDLRPTEQASPTGTGAAGGLDDSSRNRPERGAGYCQTLLKIFGCVWAGCGWWCL
jgi:hypothetical protein